MAVTALTHIGALLADRTRSSLLAVLMDGRARTGGELARQLGVAPSTASEHLSRLLDAGFVAGSLDVPPPAADAARPRAPSDLQFARSC